MEERNAFEELKSAVARRAGGDEGVDEWPDRRNDRWGEGYGKLAGFGGRSGGRGGLGGDRSVSSTLGRQVKSAIGSGSLTFLGPLTEFVESQRGIIASIICIVIQMCDREACLGESTAT